MATAGSFLCEEQFECPICAELFNNPVTLPCGHNFCNTCISRHRSDKELCQCPLCKQELNKSLKLCVNTLFRDFVDNYKQDHALEDSPTSPDDVLCDCCLHTRRKASKTCLVCLTSYCSTHLEPHLRVASLKTHPVTDPVPKLEEKICTKHNRLLEEVNDRSPVCVLCANSGTQNLPKMSEDKKQDVQYMKLNNSRKTKKNKNIKTAPIKKTESLGDFYLCFEDQLYIFSPLPLNRGFSRGRVYYDVWIKTNTIWILGVVSAKMRGKTFICPNPNSAWIVSLESRCCRCEAGCPLDTIKIPDRVFVCTDYYQGLVFICNALDGKVIFCFTNCNFREKLFLFSRQSPQRPPERSVQGVTPNTYKNTAQHTKDLSSFEVLLIFGAFVFLFLLLKG